ncbi:MAG TPA: methylated-DNA--[protein]-cysteine S-methyltransferase [Anaerolineae bacterium]|nr:methylated-DNA--[protein]-cysteine S-methyltransferase [Anaerolineae bacterium]
MSTTTQLYYAMVASPLGDVLLVGNQIGLTYINFQAGTNRLEIQPAWEKNEVVLQAAIEQIEDYFAGKRKVFDLPLAPRGTLFQQQVWEAVGNIPFGETASYGGIAGKIGRKKAARAVGAANGQNPLPIIIPCHRVIGSNGKLTGYGGGLQLKKWLLAHESK